MLRSLPSKFIAPVDACRINQTCERLDQFGLSIAFNAGDTDDLSTANIKGNIVDAFRSLDDQSLKDF